MSDSLNAAKNSMSGKYSARKCITYYFTSEYRTSSRRGVTPGQAVQRASPAAMRGLVVGDRTPASRQCQPAQALPVEGGARVGFAAWGNVAVPGNIADPVSAAQRPRERREHGVLRVGIRHVVGAFEFDPDAEIVAVFASAP